MSTRAHIDPRLMRFRNQYHQQLDVDALDYPSSQILLEPEVQEQIYHYFFDPLQSSLHPPLAYRRRVLKDLLSRIEGAIKDPNEDEISDDLMGHMALLATQQEPSAFEAAQSRSPVIYTCARGPCTNDETSIVIKESRNLLSAGGTTGMRTWDAALHLGCYLTQDFNPVGDKRILELGAGTGFLSMLCASSLGASTVVSTDGSPDVVKLIEKNIESNQQLLGTRQGLIFADVLEWGADSTIEIHNKYFSSEKPCDMVLATDVTYNLESLSALVTTFQVLSRLNPALEIWLAARLRVQNTFESFKKRCESNGFEVQAIQFACIPPTDQIGLFHDHEPPITICKIHQRAR